MKDFNWLRGSSRPKYLTAASADCAIAMGRIAGGVRRNDGDKFLPVHG
jgi:hypothetical protein